MSDVVEQVIQRHPEVKNEGMPEVHQTCLDKDPGDSMVVIVQNTQ
jgi:hypothetical protein